MKSGLACEALTVSVQRGDGSHRCLLDGISVRFSPGRVHLIRGGTGAGKTTLLHCLAVLKRPAAGSVFADGQPISRWRGRHRDRWRRQAGIAFQQPYLLDHLSVAENIMLPLIPRGMSPAVIESRSQDIMAALGVDHLAATRVAGLSGGERQRTGMARAAVSDPDFLIADEPSSQQDESGVAAVAAILTAAAGRQAVVVVATHDPRLDARLPESVIYHLADGRLETGA